MARVSDIIEMFIKELLDEANNNVVEIQRNELASYFNCAPSQINYVLTTRFNLEKGYIVESRRGGGGYIKISETNMEKEKFIRLILEEIGSSISAAKSKTIVGILKDKKFITDREYYIMNAATMDRAVTAPINLKDEIRSNILKGMIISIINFNGR